MPEFRKVVRLSKLDYYKTHLSLINCLLPIKMTPKEIEVLAGFMSLEGDIANYRFGRTGRKIIMDQLNISPSGLSNYLGVLTDKKFIFKQAYDDFTIWPVLIPKGNEQLYMFKLIKTEEDDRLSDTVTTTVTKSDQNTDQTNRTTKAETSQVE